MRKGYDKAITRNTHFNGVKVEQVNYIPLIIEGGKLYHGVSGNEIDGSKYRALLSLFKRQIEFSKKFNLSLSFLVCPVHNLHSGNSHNFVGDKPVFPNGFLETIAEGRINAKDLEILLVAYQLGDEPEKSLGNNFRELNRVLEYHGAGITEGELKSLKWLGVFHEVTFGSMISNLETIFNGSLSGEILLYPEYTSSLRDFHRIPFKKRLMSTELFSVKDDKLYDNGGNLCSLARYTGWNGGVNSVFGGRVRPLYGNILVYELYNNQKIIVSCINELDQAVAIRAEEHLYISRDSDSPILSESDAKELLSGD